MYTNLPTGFSDKTKFLIELADKAEDIMLHYFSPIGEVETTTKEDNTPVTQADIKVNQMVIDEIAEHYPEYSVYGEELGDGKGKDKLFVVDPIDGTKMFSIGSAGFIFSIALVEEGEPVAGLMRNPLAKRTLIAEKDRGAYHVESGTKLAVSSLVSFEGAMIEMGRTLASVARHIHTQGGKTPTLYSVCEACSHLASGGFDGVIFAGRGAWDTAAAAVIVEEAGGKVTDINGNRPDYNKEVPLVILSNGHLHDLLLETFKEYGDPSVHTYS